MPSIHSGLVSSGAQTITLPSGSMTPSVARHRLATRQPRTTEEDGKIMTIMDWHRRVVLAWEISMDERGRWVDNVIIERL